MPDLKVLRDLHLRPVYAGLGNYAPHVGQLVFRKGIKQSLHAFFLKMQKVTFSGNKRKKAFFNSILSSLPSSIQSSIQSGLLFDTSWYKQTRCIGVIRVDGHDYFIKSYAQPEERLFEKGQAKFIHDMFAGMFITAPVIAETGTALMFQLIPRARDVLDIDHVEERILHVVKSFLDKHNVNKEIVDCIPLNFYALCAGTEYASLSKKVRAWLVTKEQTIRHIPVHGDMTPWNMFVNPEEKIVLVDYERAGWQVPFYDLFHYVLQPYALSKDIDALKAKLFRKNWFHAEAMHVFLVLYLIDQFYLDLSDHKLHGFDNVPLMNLLHTKHAWLNELLDA